MKEKLKQLFAERGRLKPTLRWLAEISSPHKAALFTLLIVNLAITAVSVASAAINKNIVDSASSSLGIAAYASVAVLFSVFSIAAGIFLDLFSVRLTEKYSYHIRSEMFSRILNSVWKSRTGYHSENYLSRMTSDAAIVSDGVITVAIEILATVFNLVAAFFLLWHYDRTMALAAFLSGPVAALASILLAAKLRKIREEIQKSEAEYRRFLQENISNADVIKVFGREMDSVKKLDELQKNRFYWIKMQNRYSVYAGAVISAVFSGTYLFTFIWGAVQVGAGLITFGTITAYLTLIGQIQRPMLSLAKLLPSGIGIVACAGRIMEISDMPLEKHNAEGVEGLGSPIGICAENLSVSYFEKPVVSDMSFDIKPGSTVMISGGSGIGKTTLLRAILGFLPPSEGKLYFYDNGGNRVECCAGTRSLISYVPQGNTLLSGTIAENLKMGKTDATDEEMEAALRAACAWDFVNELPDGINTRIGEKGCGISEGQAQRIAIARAFLKPFGLLVLDEATSALDEDTEREILSNLKNVSKGKTCVFVSHRKSVADYADSVVKI